MPLYVITRNEDSAYVAPPGHQSHTPWIQYAKTWPNREAAEANARDDEQVRDATMLLTPPRR